MTQFHVQNSHLSGNISIPASKSQTLRAILFGLLATGKSSIQNYLPSHDTNCMIEACRMLGAKVIVFPDLIEMEGCSGKLSRVNGIIDSGNSGIILRFIGAITALSEHETIISGDHSICHNRPVMPLLEGLTQLGVSAKSIANNGFAPISIAGPLVSGKATIDGEDSQPVSSLIIASAFAQGPIEIHVNNPGEKPWVDLTLSWLDRFGIPYTRQGYSKYQLLGNGQIPGFEYRVPGDLSSLAFPVAAALITKSDISIENVDLSDCQGDKKLLDVLVQMGADITVDSKRHRLQAKGQSSKLSGLVLDINDYIDSIAVLAVIGCFAEGQLEIRNAAIARKKECDRIHCLALELKKMGADITEFEDGLLIKKSKLHMAAVSSHGDHRLAMALSIAALTIEGTCQINDVECISKTFPNFMTHFQALGAKIAWIQ